MNSSPEEALFQLALAKPAEKRAAFLDVMCEGDNALRQRLEALLAAHEQPATELGEAGESTVKADEGIHDIDEAVGQTLGRYKLLEKLGEGGCGMVYVAEQKEPVRRKVALKVIKLGMDTKQVVARFEAERQALAMMDHPNIAKVLDAGTTGDPQSSAGFQPAVSPTSSRQGVASSSASVAFNASQAGSPATQSRDGGRSLRYDSNLRAGRPYFVMELVRGIRITDYCDQANLSTKERLDLFIKVCHAIQHAHQKGIIHRDIKPSNILVTLHDGIPVPKVIDFGIAKATQGELTDKTIHTQFQQFIGTPAYMSPEQAEMSGLDIDTRSDIYSLGVLLYELLAGGTPFDAKELMASGIDAMRKTIREREPVRPSTRLATLGADQLTTTAKRRSADTSKLLHQLKGDLDWIVMKCLEKDRTRRYETANGLAADIKRHLDNEPVTARPPSAAYKFQKAFRRNKVVFAASGVVVVGLLIGLAALAFALVRERALKSESARADSIATFVTGMLNKAVPKMVLQGNSKGIRAMLESADELVSTTLTNSPAAELTIRDALQYLYGGRLDDLISNMKQTDRMESLLPLVTDDRLPLNHSRDDLRIDVAAARLWAGTVPHARADLEKLAEEFKQRGPAGNRARARILSNLGSCLNLLGKSPEAEPLLAEAYLLEQGRTGPGVYWEDFTSNPYSRALIQNGKYQQAEEVARLGANRFNAERPEKKGGVQDEPALSPRIGYLLIYPQLVEAQCKLGRFHEAETLIEEQLGSGTAQPWPPLQIKSFKTLQLAVQAYSGQWHQAASGLIALATNSVADAWDWQRGVTAALATGETNTYASLCRLGRQRFAANAEAELASALFSGLILRPQEEDLAHTLPDLLHRVEEGKDYHWSAVTLLFWSSQLAYRKGEYEEALRFLDAWGKSRDERPQNAMVLRDLRASAVPDFWRVMILARLGRTDGARKAYGDGTQKLAESFAPSSDSLFVSLITFYTSHALQQEAREVLRSKGIAVPDPEKTPTNAPPGFEPQR